MGIDKETKIGFLNIVIDDDKQYLDSLREQADEDDQNNKDIVKERGCKALSITGDKHSFTMEGYYLEDDGDGNKSIHISGELVSNNGKTSIYFDIPLSDIVLIDILEYSVKKLNKLKTVMETLK